MIRERLSRLSSQKGFSPELKFGQNFLSDENIISGILDLCDIRSGDKVLEIGPGLGSLSVPLSSLTDDLTCVEIDKRLAEFLTDDIGLKADVIVSDFLKLEDYHADMFDVVVSNLPYYVMTDIMKKLFDECVNARKMVFMVEEEALSRIFAGEGTKQYGPLAVLVSVYGEAKKEFSVPRNCFIPSPNTTSCVISLTRGENTIPEGFVSFLNNAFRMRRKKLINNCRELEDVLNTLDIDRNIRAEQLSPETLLKLYHAIIKDGNVQA